MEQNEALSKLEIELNQLISTKSGRRAFLLSLPVLLAACASKSQHRMREGDNTGQVAALTPDEERKLTQEALPEMKKEYPPHSNPEVQRYISSIGDRLVAANNLDGNPYRYNFTVVDAKMVNAFALPAGTIFVTAPLIKMAKSEAELAGVIGHEIGHVKARHTAERMALAKKEQNKSLLFGAAGAILGGAAGFGLGKLMCKKQDRECMARAALYGAGAGAAGGLLIQKFAFMANSREDEMEADRIGFRVANNAGYDKDHVGLFYERLLEMEKEYKKNQNKLLASFTDAMSTHPPSQERVVQMRQMAGEGNARKGSISSKAFERIQSLLS
ncbi:MAG: hypothetical protein Fur0010_26140 [Bdellovibrio sp.]